MKSLLTWLLLELNRQYRVEDENELYFTVGEKVKHKKIISEVLSYVDQRGQDTSEGYGYADHGDCHSGGIY